MVDIPVTGPSAIGNRALTQPDIKPQARQAGVGVAGVNGPTPNVTAPGYSAVMQSLSKFSASISGDQLDVLLAQATSKLKDIVGSTEMERLMNDEARKRSALSEKSDKLEKAEEKQKEAIEARESASIWDKVKLAFQALGAVLAITLGAVLAAVPGFQAAGAVLMAIGLVGLVMTIDAIVKEATGMGMVGNIAYEAAISDGATEAEAKKIASKADMGFQISMAIVGIYAATVSLLIPGGQASSASMFQSLAQTIGQLIKTTASMANSFTTIVSAAATTGSNVKNFQASEASAEGKNLQADGKEVDAMLQILDDFIDQVMSQINASSQRFNAMLEEIVGSMNDRSNSLARAQFAG